MATRSERSHRYPNMERSDASFATVKGALQRELPPAEFHSHQREESAIVRSPDAEYGPMMLMLVVVARDMEKQY
jgi:hypothetical protein